MSNHDRIQKKAKRLTPSEQRQIRVLMSALAEELRIGLISRAEYAKRARELLANDD